MVWYQRLARPTLRPPVRQMREDVVAQEQRRGPDLHAVHLQAVVREAPIQARPRGGAHAEDEVRRLARGQAPGEERDVGVRVPAGHEDHAGIGWSGARERTVIQP
jgi:hypothetical protein